MTTEGDNATALQLSFSLLLEIGAQTDRPSAVMSCWRDFEHKVVNVEVNDEAGGQVLAQDFELVWVVSPFHR